MVAAYYTAVVVVAVDNIFAAVAVAIKEREEIGEKSEFSTRKRKRRIRRTKAYLDISRKMIHITTII